MIHRYQSNGYYIVVDAESGAIHGVDELAYEIIGLYESHAKEEIIRLMLEKYRHDAAIDQSAIEETLAEIEDLKEQGKLFAPPLSAEIAPALTQRSPVLKALCLHMAHDCNMVCGYCFAGKGKYRGQAALMSFETGKQALDFLIKHSPGRRNLEVDFFGGEPLLNFEVIKKLVAYGRSQEEAHGKKFRFTLTTNGLLLNDEVTAFANEEMSNVVLSLDGRREINDALRRTPNGTGTYELVLPAFKKLAQMREQKDYYIRGTYTKYNRDFASDILHLADLGFEQISMEPVVALPEAPYALSQEDVPLLCEEYQRLAEEMLRRKQEGRGFTFFHFILDLMRGPCAVKRLSGCGVGREYLAVTPQGELYPCHQFVGDKKYLIGNLQEGITNLALQQAFDHCQLENKAPCQECFAKLYCGGGCPANAYHACGEIQGIYELGCQLHRKRIECAIMLQVAEAFGS